MALPKVLDATEDVLLGRLSKYSKIVQDMDKAVETGFYTYIDSPKNLKYLLTVEVCNDCTHIIQEAIKIHTLDLSYENVSRISWDGGSSWTSWEAITSELREDLLELDKFKLAKPIEVNDVLVTVDSWVESTLDEKYPHQSTVLIEGATSSMRPEVCFAFSDAISSNFAPVAESVNGGVIIYAKEIPEVNITLSSVILWKRGDDNDWDN